MTIGWAVFMAALGGTWRWIHGRGFGARWQRLVLAGVLALLATVFLEWWQMVLITAILVVNWTLGYTDWEDILFMTLRYSVPAVAIMLVLIFTHGPLALPWLLTGPLVALVYWVMMVRFPNPKSNEISEVFLGAAFYGPLPLYWSV